MCKVSANLEKIDFFHISTNFSTTLKFWHRFFVKNFFNEKSFGEMDFWQKYKCLQLRIFLSVIGKRRESPGRCVPSAARNNLALVGINSPHFITFHCLSSKSAFNRHSAWRDDFLHKTGVTKSMWFLTFRGRIWTAFDFTIEKFDSKGLRIGLNLRSRKRLFINPYGHENSIWLVGSGSLVF